MWILVAEAMGALCLLLFIVWWTLGPTQRREREAVRRLAEEAAAARVHQHVSQPPSAVRERS